MKATLLITSYKRANLLKFGLASIAKQEFSRDDVEIVVLNDGVEDETEKVCESFEDRLNIHYLFTGKNSKGWRIPGFAINYGVKQTDSDFLIIACAEMYHFVGNTIDSMLRALEKNPKFLTIPYARDDDGSFLAKLMRGEAVNVYDYNRLGLLHNIHLPFFMGMNRDDFIKIGGYDEDFIGAGYDDNDIVERMKLAGNVHLRVECSVVHLYHPRITLEGVMGERYKYNEQLCFKKRGQIIRNLGKDWGNL